MARRNPPAKWTLPDVVNPPDSICITVPVPNDRKHIGAFYGAIFNLTSARFWQDDTAHTAKEVAAVWRAIFDDLAPGACDFNVPDLIEEMEYQMSICEQLRFNNGKLQGLCCGEWVDIAGQGSNPPGGGDQPGGGTEQPGAGDCVTYHANFAATNKWYLPTIVNSGDTLTVSLANGAGNDGTVSPWRCPTGDTFFAGACIGGTGGPSGGDPAAAANHMELVLNIDGTWYRPLQGAVTVPGGVVNAEAYFQVNDSVLDDNAGSYVFDVEVCNNLAVPWVKVFDFKLSTGGWYLQTYGTPGFDGVWTPGVGWEDTDNAYIGLNVRGVNILLDVPGSYTVTQVEIEFSFTQGTYDNLPQHAQTLYIGASPILDRSTPSLVTGSNKVDFATGSVAAGTPWQLYYYSDDTAGAPTGNVLITKLTVTGEGPDPF